MALSRNFLNVMILSWGFMLVFTAFQTMGNIEKTVLQSIKKENPDFTGEAYTSLAIIYAVFAICNWLAPSFISMTGPRVAIVTGAGCYVIFIASFHILQNAVLYAASGIVGLGAALIWTGHGQYLTENSDSETMPRNAGIFWAIFQTSMFAGNLFVYYVFTDSTINRSTRQLVFGLLTGLALLGTLLLAALRKTSQGIVLGEELRIPEPAREKPLLAAWRAFTDAFALFRTPEMLLLSLTFVYTGLVLTFYSGVYSSSIGFTKAIDNSPKSLVGLSGIFIGIGEVIGGALFGIFASKVSRICGVWAVVITGFCMHLFAFITIFINLPKEAPFEDTDSIGYINPSPVLAMAGSLTLGFGDACFNTQVYSLLGLLFAQRSAPAFALFKFCQSVAAAISFAYSSILNLHIQLLILTISIIIGTVTFCYVEYGTRRERNNTLSENEQISN
ncbi:UNC93-like protein MFSD11 [Habropoda laboriosa]|uniref:UNC93-like protein MFSD11 n=1 Tax=Habropoda laboriosa TaxID=597456 RepID=A0A0L7QWB2_9HYME|nr:PREDICTED: UNC93-like protein MFSD11 [Habropoda laboriosa]KOC62902.1 UNC93-like protein MFSD11 [Habropoda laboriosa]